MQPQIIQGSLFSDDRGSLKYNNSFDASAIKRFYIIQNWNTEFIRGWQGHKIEQRWFAAISGSFRIKLIVIDNWENPSATSESQSFILRSNELDILYCPPGYITAIQALEENSKLLVMADYLLGQTNDEQRYPLEYFITSLNY